MAKKLLSLVIALLVLQSLVGAVKAASDPKILFGLDCTSAEKVVQVGFQSNPDDPANGPEIIAARFTLTLTPSGATSLDDIKNASLQLSGSASNAVPAENSTTTVGSSIETKIMVAFSTGSGLPQSKDIVLVKGIDKKAYQISVKSAELYPKNSTSNIYKGGSASFLADPVSCVGATSSTPATSSITAVTAITLTSDKSLAKPGDSVTVTALVQNRNGGNIDWTQKSGGSFQPQIANQDQADGSTKSTLTFVMPAAGDSVKLEVKVGASVQSTTIALDKPAGSQADTSTPSDSLEERLRKRREAQQSNSGAADIVTPSDASSDGASVSSIHQAAGQTNLTGSGPRENVLLAGLGSIGILMLWKIVKKKS